jgi:hypothetical protein
MNHKELSMKSFKDLYLESAVAPEFKRGLYNLKGVYGNDEVPSQKTLVDDAKRTAEYFKIKDVDGFVKYCQDNIKTSGK